MNCKIQKGIDKNIDIYTVMASIRELFCILDKATFREQVKSTYVYAVRSNKLLALSRQHSIERSFLKSTSFQSIYSQYILVKKAARFAV